jgi:type II secretory pathway component HofQ
MIVRQAAALSVGALAFLAAQAHAGPCENEIYQADIAINKRLDAAAARGKPAPESTFATMHRQPTPQSVAGAEEKAGDLSEADVKAIAEFMDEARKADAGGDRPACEKALADVRTVLDK